MPPIARYDTQDATESGGGPPIRFSLAGVQLKFSMAHRGSLTVPAIHGQGRFILKTPSPDYRLLPEAEWTALHLAKLAGVRVAEARLVESDKIEGVPKRYLQGSALSLVVERFDRKSDGSRVQAEDFAQIMGAVGDQKYTKANETTVMKHRPKAFHRQQR
jgi:serine/threonine-protein kinase HipA